jgi:signal transduction histidine kinase
MLLELTILRPDIAKEEEVTFYLTQLLITLSFGFILLLNFFKRTTASRVMFSMFLPLVFLPNSYLINEPLRTEFYMYGFAAIVFILFQQKRWIIPLFFVPMIVFFLMVINLSKVYPDIFMINTGTIARIFISFFMIYIAMTLLLKENRRYEREIEIKNRSLTIQQSRLNRLNNAKDKIFSIIGHDLRSPISSLLAILKMLQKKQISKEEFEHYASSMYLNVEQLHATLDNLLYWAQSQAGGMSAKPQEVNIGTLIGEVTQLNSVLATSKNIEIQIDGSVDFNVVADLTMSKSVLINLIGNAIKFTDSGGTILISVNKKDEFAEVHVHDNGGGMTKETVNNLFMLSENRSTLGTRKEAGTGLGLLLCKEFVEKNGGTISVHSEPGKGSDFYFTLPLLSS